LCQWLRQQRYFANAMTGEVIVKAIRQQQNVPLNKEITEYPI
jgi:hypothetical protein